MYLQESKSRGSGSGTCLREEAIRIEEFRDCRFRVCRGMYHNSSLGTQHTKS